LVGMKGRSGLSGSSGQRWRRRTAIAIVLGAQAIGGCLQSASPIEPTQPTAQPEVQTEPQVEVEQSKPLFELHPKPPTQPPTQLPKPKEPQQPLGNPLADLPISIPEPPPPPALVLNPATVGDPQLDQLDLQFSGQAEDQSDGKLAVAICICTLTALIVVWGYSSSFCEIARKWREKWQKWRRWSAKDHENST